MYTFLLHVKFSMYYAKLKRAGVRISFFCPVWDVHTTIGVCVCVCVCCVCVCTWHTQYISVVVNEQDADRMQRKATRWQGHTCFVALRGTMETSVCLEFVYSSP